MRIKTIAVCLFFFTIFFSCKKEDLGSSLGPGSTTSPALHKIIVDDQLVNEYVYNDAGLLWEERSKFDLTSYTYDAQGVLQSSKSYGNDDILSTDAAVSDKAMSQSAMVTLSTGKESGSVQYQYNKNGQLIKSISSRPSVNSNEYSEFAYDSNNRINKQTIYWENVATGYIEYAYDTKGNLTSEKLYNMPASGPAELVTVTTYTFDSQYNPFRFYSKLPIPGINTNLNNIVKETHTMHVSSAGDSDKIVETVNTYKYNAMGYPVSKNDNETFVY
jgi:hypothetical protein